MSRQSEHTHYDILGVSRTADSAEIRRAYRRLVRRHHPDLTAGRPESDHRRAEARIRELNRAWSVLGDPSARRDYDRELRRREQRTGSPVEATRPRPPSTHPSSGPASRRPPSTTGTGRPPVDSDLTDVAPGLSPAFVRVLLWGPVVLIVVIGVVLFVFTAYAGTGDDAGGGSADDATASCVLRGEGREAVRVDCDEPNDGTVVSEAVDAAQCPLGTTPLIITEPVFDGWVCAELSPSAGEVPTTN